MLARKVKNCLSAKKSKEKAKLRLVNLSHKNLFLEIDDLNLDEDKKSVLTEKTAIMEKIRKVQNQINKYKAFKANVQMPVASQQLDRQNGHPIFIITRKGPITTKEESNIF